MDIENLISVIVPTFGHPDMIGYFLEKCVSPYEGNLFSFHILDGSEDRQTETLITKFNSSHLRKIDYVHLSKCTAEKKIEYGFCHISSPFYYVFGDGVLADFSLLQRFLISIRFTQYSVVSFDFTFDDSLKKFLVLGNDQVKEYSSFLDFVSDCSVPLTLFGGSIISGKVRKRIIDQSLLSKYNRIKSNFAYPFSIIDAISNEKDDKFCFFYSSALTGASPFKRSSGWFLSGATIKTFCCNYYESLLLLDPAYNSIRSLLLTAQWEKTYLGKFRTLLLMRSRQYKNLTFRIVDSSRFYVKKTVPMYGKIILCLLVPSFIPSFLVDCHRLLKKIRIFWSNTLDLFVV